MTTKREIRRVGFDAMVDAFGVDPKIVMEKLAKACNVNRELYTTVLQGDGDGYTARQVAAIWLMCEDPQDFDVWYHVGVYGWPRRSIMISRRGGVERWLTGIPVPLREVMFALFEDCLELWSDGDA